MDNNKKKKSLKRRTATAAVAAAASAGVVLGGLFESPEDLLNSGGEDAPEAVAAAFHSAEAEAAEGESLDDEAVETDDEEERRRGGVRARARAWILRLPFGVRAAVGVPLWALGSGILWLLSALWGTVLSPAVRAFLPWLCLAAMLLGVFLLAAKTMFPDLPLRKILNRRSLLALLLGAAALWAADALIPLFEPGYRRVSDIVSAAAATLLLLGVTAAFAARERKRRRIAREELEAAEAETDEEEEEEPLELRQQRALREVLEMADAAGRRE